jgi:hypothetical protein
MQRETTTNFIKERRFNEMRDIRNANGKLVCRLDEKATHEQSRRFDHEQVCDISTVNKAIEI